MPLPLDNSGSETVIKVVSWFLLVATALAALTRVGTKLLLSRKIMRDDGLLLAALVSLCPLWMVGLSFLKYCSRLLAFLRLSQYPYKL